MRERGTGCCINRDRQVHSELTAFREVALSHISLVTNRILFYLLSPSHFARHSTKKCGKDEFSPDGLV